jgi:radical SAM superfamily enzyme YgiQ (UPF0313 family)
MTIIQTKQRQQFRNLDELPLINRSLIDYNAYHKYIGHAGVKYSMAVQATRGCPYKCFYCDIYKTAKNHFRRSDDHLFNEIQLLHDMGVRRVEFIDDIFNVNSKGFIRFFEMVIKRNLNMQFFFPTGLKGDLLTKDMIDLMVEGGSVGINLSLEHASPRMQGVMRKNLNVDKLKENLTYISEKHPSVILTLNAMHGFPTETEDEAMETLNFIKSIKWLDFPYLHNVRIFPGTELEEFALEVGIPRELIEGSQDMSYHEFAPTLPFPPEFTRAVRASFLHDYVLNKERLLSIIPHQLEQFSEDELNQKYNSYFPSPKIKTLDDVLKLARISRADLRPLTPFKEESVRIPELNTKLKEFFPPRPKRDKEALKVLMLDLSTYFTDDVDSREYNVLEPPLGLMALATYADRELGGSVDTKLCKSRIDFDSYEDLYQLVLDYGPDIIGIRAMTFYKGFFHDCLAYLRERGVKTPIIAGGPYATASFNEILDDPNIDLVAIAEGEDTLVDLLKRTLKNGGKFPDRQELRDVGGIAFREDAPAIDKIAV